MEKKIAIITPRYGADIGGGAEIAARGFAEEAVQQGWQVEVWTTCATSHMTWENVWPSGKTIDNGVTVRRFPVESSSLTIQAAPNTKTKDFLKAGDRLPSDFDWLSSGPQSPQMYQHIARHGAEFDALVPGPYTFTIAHYAAWIYPERTIFWPHLHNEIQAFSEPVRLTLEKVAGVLFNSPEGQEFAIKQLAFQLKNQSCLGEGVAFAPAKESKMPVHSVPHLLHIGRLESAKNVSEMYNFVQLYAENVGDIRLTVAGKGPMPPPDLPYIDFRGFVSNEEKAKLYATSTAHWLPSISESFSLVTMESWLSGRPVLVNRNCHAPAGHVQRSKGGLAYSGFWEFSGAVQWLQANPQLADRMGQNGKQYVEQNYRWPVIVKRFEALTTEWMAN